VSDFIEATHCTKRQVHFIKQSDQKSATVLVLYQHLSVSEKELSDQKSFTVLAVYDQFAIFRCARQCPP
jgi:hypothetical protein